jgi:enoyl-CoA hydratase
MNRPGANAFTPELVAELRHAVLEARQARALVIASALPKIFSGGWDLPDVTGRPFEEFEAFVTAYCDLIREIFVYGGPVVAALSGHAVAGGLILAAAADERIAADSDAVFGLSEVALGVPVPRPLLEIFRHVLGTRGMERLAASGENIPVARAIAIGLVDRAVPPGELIESAVARARQLAGNSPEAHAEIKRRARADAVARFDESRRGDPFFGFWQSPAAQARIGTLVQRLTRNR